MATAAFRSSSRRSSGIGAADGDCAGSATRSAAYRRSRSLSRCSPSFPPAEYDDAPAAPRGRFVNMERGSGFPEISLDDLANEFFGKWDAEAEERGRGGGGSTGRRRSDAGFAMETESSRRRGRSVSRKEGVEKSLGSKGGADSGARRGRSVSVARYRRSDSEGEMDFSHSNSFTKLGVSGSGDNRKSSPPKLATSDPVMRRTSSKKNMQPSHDSYSSHSSSVTDDEGRGVCSNGSGSEKMSRAAYAQKKGMVKTKPMIIEDFQRKNMDSFQTIAEIRRNYTTKLEESEKRKQELLAELSAEEHRGQELTKIFRELLHDAKQPAKQEKSSRGRRRSNDKTRVSMRLTEEAEKYFEDFISNVEDTDLSSFDGERSDTSSTLGIQGYPMKVPSLSVESDGVVLPWLQWETTNDASPLPKSKMDAQLTSPNNVRYTTEESSPAYGHSNLFASSRGSCSPNCDIASVSKEKKTSRFTEIRSYLNNLPQRRERVSSFHMNDYLNLHKNEDILFETFRQRPRMESGGLILCCGNLFR